MKRNHFLFALIAVLGSAATLGCGDNSRQCGANTSDVDGVCVGDGAPIQCTDGTKLNDAMDGCVIDPAACQDGTVLVGSQCVDPGHVTPNINEAAEPNGLGLLGEDSKNPAGDVLIQPVGTNFVVKGQIIPFQDLDGDGQLDPDVDTYLVEVTAPVMLSVSSDGLHGLAGGFFAVAVVDPAGPLGTWTRFGVNLTGDTSKRQLFLPAAGTYALAVADSRTLFLGGSAAGAETGALPFEYYMTISQLTATPAVLPITDGIGNSTSELAPGEVKLFSVAMGEGINTAELNVNAAQAVGSLVVTNTTGVNTVVKGVVDADPSPATLASLGFKAGDTTLIAVDHLFNFAAQPIDYVLIVTTGGAGALSTNGGAVTQPSDAIDFSVFFYDVAADLEITGMDLAWDVPVVGFVLDESAAIFANFTFDPASGFQFQDTFTSYRGLLRHPTAGRYYFLVFDPTLVDPDVGTIEATSTYAPVAAVAVVKDTPLTAQAVNAFESNPFTYVPGAAVAWQQFNGTGTGTGNLTAQYFDPNTTFGRLDTLISTCFVDTDGDNIPDTDFCADVAPVFTHTYAAAGTPQGRILLDDQAAMITSYLLTVNTATVTGTPTFNLDNTTRPHTDLATVAVGTPATANAQVLDATTTLQRYLLRSAAGNGLDINVSPSTTLNTRIQRQNNNETARGALVDNGIVGADDTVQILQSGEGWTAFTVTQSAVVAGTFDLTVTASAPVTYTATAGATPFADACAGGGTPIALDDNDDGRSVAAIATPAGFKFFGFASPQVRMFSNGFLSFDSNLACAGVCFFSNADIPNAATPNSLAAPYWDDLVLDTVGGACQKTVGNKLVIQWKGIRFGSAVDLIAFQAILDPATNTIEFVYDTTQVGTGLSATIGIENQIGSVATKIGFNTAGAIAPATSKLFTPN